MAPGNKRLENNVWNTAGTVGFCVVLAVCLADHFTSLMSTHVAIVWLGSFRNKLHKNEIFRFAYFLIVQYYFNLHDIKKLFLMCFD